jgi:hypothetical protein
MIKRDTVLIAKCRVDRRDQAYIGNFTNSYVRLSRVMRQRLQREFNCGARTGPISSARPIWVKIPADLFC